MYLDFITAFTVKPYFPVITIIAREKCTRVVFPWQSSRGLSWNYVQFEGLGWPTLTKHNPTWEISVISDTLLAIAWVFTLRIPDALSAFINR